MGASNFLPWTVWTKRFLEAQRHKVVTNIYFQDNESAMKMEMHGRKFCGYKSRHICIRYFFIKDVVIEREDMNIEHCKTCEMLADSYSTKPLQEVLFRKMRNRLMGLTESLDEEHVEHSELEGTSKDLSVPLTQTYAEIVRGKKICQRMFYCHDS